jgi:hypothetical protein
VNTTLSNWNLRPRAMALCAGAMFVAASATAPFATALAQSAPPQCAAFVQLREEAQQKAMAVRTAIDKKVDRKDVCTLVQRFYSAEGTVVKFLEENKSWCNIPDQAITAAKQNHERTLKFRTAACTETPQAKPRPPSLSDAIGTPSVDTRENTKTGHGTLDSLSGNPLAK